MRKSSLKVATIVLAPALLTACDESDLYRQERAETCRRQVESGLSPHNLQSCRGLDVFVTAGRIEGAPAPTSAPEGAPAIPPIPTETADVPARTGEGAAEKTVAAATPSASTPAPTSGGGGGGSGVFIFYNGGLVSHTPSYSTSYATQYARQNQPRYSTGNSWNRSRPYVPRSYDSTRGTARPAGVSSPSSGAFGRSSSASSSSSTSRGGAFGSTGRAAFGGSSS